MKTIILLNIVVLFISINCNSQVTWQFTSKKLAHKTYEIRLTATVDDPWHIYSQTSPKGGPLPTSIVFNKNPLAILQGKIKEDGEMEIYHEETFDVDVYSYTGKVDFVQTVKLKTNVKTNIGGELEYMACTKQQCLTPQKVKFNVKLE